MYVHCAAGHGRSALTVAAYLLETGQASDAEAAREQVAAARPGIGLKRGQRATLGRVQARRMLPG